MSAPGLTVACVVCDDMGCEFCPGAGPPNCPTCCEGMGEPLGVLGSKFWFRCRACGLDFAVEADDE